MRVELMGDEFAYKCNICFEVITLWIHCTAVHNDYDICHDCFELYGESYDEKTLQLFPQPISKIQTANWFGLIQSIRELRHSSCRRNGTLEKCTICMDLLALCKVHSLMCPIISSEAKGVKCPIIFCGKIKKSMAARQTEAEGEPEISQSVDLNPDEGIPEGSQKIQTRTINENPSTSRNLTMGCCSSTVDMDPSFRAEGRPDPPQPNASSEMAVNLKQALLRAPDGPEKKKTKTTHGAEKKLK